jgi:hypothetical protein
MSAWENTATERAWRAFRWHVGSGIFRIGERITSLGEGIRSAQWDTSREQCHRDGFQFGLETGMFSPEVAQRYVDEAERRCEAWFAAQV